MQLKCPNCAYIPDGGEDWNCQACGSEFDMFVAGGRCPSCDFVHELTPCIPWKGGCDRISPHLDWYSGIDRKLERLGIVKTQDR